MDLKFLTLVKHFQQMNQPLYLSCLINNVLVTGCLVNEQKFFVETGRIMNDKKCLIAIYYCL